MHQLTKLSALAGGMDTVLGSLRIVEPFVFAVADVHIFKEVAKDSASLEKFLILDLEITHARPALD